MPAASPECPQVTFQAIIDHWGNLGALYPPLLDADNRKMNTSFPRIHRNNLVVPVINGKLSSVRVSHCPQPEPLRSLYAGQALDSLAQLDI